MGQECQFLIFVGSTKMQFLNISSVFLALLESSFFAFFSCVFCGFGRAQTNPAQPNQPTQPSAARPASQPTNPPKNYEFCIHLSETLKVKLEQPIHGNILGHSATVGVFVAIEFNLCDVFLKLLVTRSRTWQRKWHGRGTECTKTRRHGPNRTEQEPDRPQTDAKKVYWKPFPGASKTRVFISYSFCDFLIFWVKLRPQK